MAKSSRHRSTGGASSGNGADAPPFSSSGVQAQGPGAAAAAAAAAAATAAAEAAVEVESSRLASDVKELAGDLSLGGGGASRNNIIVKGGRSSMISKGINSGVKGDVAGNSGVKGRKKVWRGKVVANPPPWPVPDAVDSMQRAWNKRYNQELQEDEITCHRCHAGNERLREGK